MFKSVIIFILLENYLQLVPSLSIVDKGVLPLVKKSVAIQFYIDVENPSRLHTCTIESKHKCHLADHGRHGTVPMEVYTKPFEVVRPRDRRTILFVSPMLHQHDLKGYCDISLKSRCNSYQSTQRVELPFDTTATKRPKRLLKNYLQGDRGTVCETIDQDSLNDCEPANCDLKYLGFRSYYDTRVSTCVGATACIRDFDKELPDIVYVPDVNTCRDLDMPITVQDIYAITSGLGTVAQTTIPDDVNYIEARSNCSTISENINLLKDLFYGKLCPCADDKVVDFSGCCKSACLHIILCILSITAVLFSCICCINISVKLYTQWSDGKYKDVWKKLKGGIHFRKRCKKKRSQVDKEIRNALLKDVIVRDIPIELRESVVNVCDRMGREVRNKTRYRDADIGSQISLIHEKDSNLCLSSNSDTED